MTTAQKIIKYLAVAFAIFLIMTIISAILSVILALSGILGLKTAVQNSSTELIATTFENAEIDLDDTNGISLVLVNSEKGKYILDQVVEQLQIAKSDKKRCWQIHLEFPNNAPNGRGKFWKEYWKKGANKALKKYTKGSLMNRFIRKVSPILRKLGLYTIVAKVHHMIGKR